MENSVEKNKDSSDNDEKQECAKNSDNETFEEPKSNDRSINIITKSPR